MTNQEQINDLCNFTDLEWRTFAQWKNAGCSIKKGEHGTLIEGYGCKRDYRKSKRGRKYFYKKKIYVFSEEQVEGYTRPDETESDLDLLLD